MKLPHINKENLDTDIKTSSKTSSVASAKQAKLSVGKTDRDQLVFRSNASLSVRD